MSNSRIETITAYKTSNGKVFENLGDALECERRDIVVKYSNPIRWKFTKNQSFDVDKMLNSIIANSDADKMEEIAKIILGAH